MSSLSFHLGHFPIEDKAIKLIGIILSKIQSKQQTVHIDLLKLSVILTRFVQMTLFA